MIETDQQPMEGIEPERQLWCAVIERAVLDAQSIGKTDTIRRERDAAISWLTRPYRGFNQACSLAGLDPEAVRERSRRLFAQAEGGGSELGEVLGTGGGSVARDISQLEFSE